MAKKPGKYAHLISRLPKGPAEPPERFDILVGVRERIDTPTGRDTTNDHLVLRELINRIETNAKLLMDLEATTTNGAQSAPEYARVYAELRDIIDRLEALKSQFNLLLEAYLASMLKKMEDDNLTGLSLNNGRSITTYVEPYPQVTNPEAFRQWCLARPDIAAKMTLHPSTTAALVKDMLLEGEAEPDGITSYMKTKVRLL